MGIRDLSALVFTWLAKPKLIKKEKFMKKENSLWLKHGPMTTAVFITTVGWTILSTLVNLPAWPAFIGWSLFYLIGADKESVKMNVPSLVGGVILAYLTATLLAYLALPLIPHSLLVGVMAALAVLLKDSVWFKMISTVFIGINLYFALGNVVLAIILPIVGLIMGLITNALIVLIEKSYKR